MKPELANLKDTLNQIKKIQLQAISANGHYRTRRVSNRSFKSFQRSKEISKNTKKTKSQR